MIRVGIDIDGTITKYPQVFSKLAEAVLDSGGEVYIITGLGINGAIEKMDRFPNMRYTKMITTASYNDAERKLLAMNTLPNEYVVGVFKQRICTELGIDVMFDDKALVHGEVGRVPIFYVF